MTDKPRILWASVSPNICSGYGRVTNEVVHRLTKAGYDVMCYGLQTQGKPHKMVLDSGREFQMLPFKEDLETEEDFIQKFYRYMVQYKRQIIVTLWDVWNLDVRWAEAMRVWVPYVPIDGEPLGEANRIRLIRAWHSIAMSAFGQRMMADEGINSTFIPHGVDTAIYKPPDKNMRAGLRSQMGLKDGSFLIGTVGKNYMDRKMFPRMLRVVKKFIDTTKADAYLYMHMNKYPRREHDGYEMDELIRMYGMTGRVLFPSMENLPDDILAALYGAMDLYLSTSGGEGFGLPLIEAQACGVPVVCAGNSAQTELVEGHGWVVPCSDHTIRLTTPVYAKWGLVDVDKCAEALGEAYDDRELLTRCSNYSLAFSKEFDWQRIVDKKWIPFFDMLMSTKRISDML